MQECFYLYLPDLSLPGFLLLLINPEDDLLILLERVSQVDNLALLLPEDLLKVPNCTVRRAGCLVVLLTTLLHIAVLRGVCLALSAKTEKLPSVFENFSCFKCGDI